MLFQNGASDFEDKLSLFTHARSGAMKLKLVGYKEVDAEGNCDKTTLQGFVIDILHGKHDAKYYELITRTSEDTFLGFDVSGTANNIKCFKNVGELEGSAVDEILIWDKDLVNFVALHRNFVCVAVKLIDTFNDEEINIDNPESYCGLPNLSMRNCWSFS